MDTVTPETYLIGVTQPDIDGMFDYLLDTDNMEFLDEFRDAFPKYGPLCMASFYAKLCYRSLTAKGQNTNVKKVRDIGDNIQACFNSGHGSVFEHVQLNFVTRNCSRAFTHQMVRHRVGTAYSQQSGHYCSTDDAKMILPPNAPDGLVEAYESMLDNIKSVISEWRGHLNLDAEPMGVRKYWTSVLRRLLPEGANTELGWSINVRSLRHVIELRTDPSNIWEIRRIFTDVGRMVNKRWPLMLHGGKCYTDTGTDLDHWTGLRV